MNSIFKIVIAILAAFSVIFEILTPIAVALFWGSFFNLSDTANILIITLGGLATLFRAFKIGWITKD